MIKTSKLRFRWSLRSGFAWLGFLIGLGWSASAQQIANDQCFKCHADQSILKARPESLLGMVSIASSEDRILATPEQIQKLYVHTQSFLNSAHGGLNCVDCHRDIEKLPHNQRVASVSCDSCHPQAASDLVQSIHAPKAGSNSPLPGCAECHGDAHQIDTLQAPRSYNATLKLTQACMQCHDTAADSPAQTYRDHVHGKALFDKGLPLTATCADCHGAHHVLPVADTTSPANPFNSPQTCGKCHEGVTQTYMQSVHGQQFSAGNHASAVCTNCHSSHGIGAVGTEFEAAMVNECSHCHAELGQSYMTSYHGKATLLGGHATAVCSSCHGVHDILPASDPRSHVAKANLVETCGKCHENVNANFIEFIPHVRLLDRKANPEVFWTFIIMTGLLLSVMAVFLPHCLLWFQRSFLARLRHLRGGHTPPAEVRWVRRFRPIHRFTHALIVISFMGLVMTGFPLKYSHTEWARSIAEAFGGVHMMGVFHRGFALITFCYAGIHLGFLVWFFWKHCPSPRLRYIVGPESMLFSKDDFRQFIAMIRWFLWRGPRPRFDRWTYFEKFDYFGEIWGVFLIGGTGMILWFPTLFTRWLPGWVLNCALVVHSIEALLAASVIFLVHFFNTHLRPEKFPIDMVMLTGSMREDEMKEERPAEYDRLVASGELEQRIVQPMSRRGRIIGTVLGITAFLLGMFLIGLAIRTELGQLFK